MSNNLGEYKYFISPLPAAILNAAKEDAWKLGLRLKKPRHLEYGQTGQNSSLEKKEAGDTAENTATDLQVDLNTGARCWDLGPGVAKSKTGPRPHRWDPQSIGEIMRKEFGRTDFDAQLKIVWLRENWQKVAGSFLASHSRVEKFENSKLYVRADTLNYRQEMVMLLPSLERKIDEELGCGLVRQLIILGPQERKIAGSLRVRNYPKTDPYH